MPSEPLAPILGSVVVFVDEISSEFCLFQYLMKAKMDRLGELLVDARKRQELTLRAVEQSVGVSNAYLSQLETGKIKSPSPVVLHKLAELYELPYGQVMQAAGYPLPKETRPTDSEARLAARIGKVTADEEDAIVEYVRFIRSQRNRRNRK